jgi:voltage-gated potassium channel
VTALVHAGATGEALHDLGVEVTLSIDDLLSHTLAKSLEAPHAAALLLELIDSERHTLCEIPVEASQTGQSLSSLRAANNDLVLGLVHAGEVSLGIGADPMVGEGDQLLVARPVSS